MRGSSLFLMLENVAISESLQIRAGIAAHMIAFCDMMNVNILLYQISKDWRTIRHAFTEVIEKTPYVMKLSSNLAIRRANILIDDLARINQISPKPDFKEKDFVKSMQVNFNKKK